MLKRTKKLLSMGVLALTLTTTALTGCSSNNTTSDDSSSGDEKQTLYFIPIVDTGAYWNPMRLGAEEEAERLGYNLVVKTSPPAQTDKNAMHINFINEAVTNKAAGIAISPIEANMFKNTITDAMSAGIPVITFDADLEDEADRTAYVGTNNELAGAELAKNAIAKMKEEGIASGSISIVCVDKSQPTMIAREKGIKDEFEKQGMTGFKFLETIMDNDQAAVSKQQLEGQITANSDLKVVFSLGSEGPDVGVMEALASQNKAGDILHFGFDYTPTWEKGMEDGRITGFVDQDAYQIGVQVIDNLVKAIEGKEVDKTIPISVKYVEAKDIKTYGEEKSKLTTTETN